MSVCNYYPLLERKGNLLWRTWAVVLIRIQFCFLKTNKETNDKREGWVKKRNGGRRGRINSFGSGFLPAWLLQEKKKKKKRHSMWFYHLLQDLAKMCQCQSISGTAFKFFSGHRLTAVLPKICLGWQSQAVFKQKEGFR